MKKAREDTVAVSELVRRRKILERRQNHLFLMMRKSRLEPVMKEQPKVEYENTENLCLEVIRFGRFVCEVTIPEATMNREVTIIIDLQDAQYDIGDSESNKLKVSVTTKTGEAVVVKLVKDVGDKKFAVLFTPRAPENHSLAVIVNGNQIPGSPYR